MVVAQATGDAGSVGVLTASIVLGAFILKLVDLVKYVTAGQARSAFTLLLTWGVGFAAVQVFMKLNGVTRSPSATRHLIS